MKVIIIGAGIAGLSTGILLTRQGHECYVYENAVEILPIGAAISLHSSGIRCINEMGFKAELEAMGGIMNKMCYRDNNTGEDLVNFGLQEVYEYAGTRTLPVSRAKLQAFLMTKFEEISGHKVQLGHQCIDIAQDANSATISFANGITVTGDLCVGCDGVHSIVRKFIFAGEGLEVPPRRYVGYVNYNSLVPAIQGWPGDQWTIYVGEGKRASLMPIDEGKFYCFMDIPLPIDQALMFDRANFLSELQEQFKSFPEPVQQLISTIDINQLNRIPIYDMDPIVKCYHGRLVLAGDAKSVMSPDLGSAGSLALEDAIYLARQIQTNGISLENALQRYESVRLPRCHGFLQRCRERADMLHGTSSTDPELTNTFYKGLKDVDCAAKIIVGLKKNATGGPLD